MNENKINCPYCQEIQLFDCEGRAGDFEIVCEYCKRTFEVTAEISIDVFVSKKYPDMDTMLQDLRGEIDYKPEVKRK